MTFQKVVLLLSFFTMVGVVLPASWVVSADDKRVERDIDGDGKIDQIAHLDRRGNPVRLEIDSDGNGIFDKFQVYRDGRLTRIDSDRNQDGTIDTRDVFEQDKRVTHERISTATGRLEQVIRFDDQQRPLTMDRDTTADGRFDTHHEFDQGRLASSTRDTDGDEQVNVWQTYRNDLPTQLKSDGDGDGRIERVVLFDEKGRPHLSRHDLNADGTFETVRHYIEGKISRQEKDENSDGRPDIVLHFENALPALKKETPTWTVLSTLRPVIKRGNRTERKRTPTSTGSLIASWHSKPMASP